MAIRGVPRSSQSLRTIQKALLQNFKIFHIIPQNYRIVYFTLIPLYHQELTVVALATSQKEMEQQTPEHKTTASNLMFVVTPLQ